MKSVLHWLYRVATAVKARFSSRYKTVVVEELLPPRLRAKTLYIVQEDGYFEHVAMLCPCGCDRTLQLNLLTDIRPCWKVERHKDGTTTLTPSVWRQKDCRSHFWFRRGRVEWVSELNSNN
jgi:hypothetical protein